MQAWTSSQKQAINDRSGTLLVAASAGAGKTAVLTERLVTLLLDPVQPISWDQLLVVTFSDPAAVQMRERVEARLRQLAADNPADRRIAWQLALLPRAQICTLHAFCLELIRRHFLDLQLDPDVGVASPEEMALLRQEVLDEVLEQAYHQASRGGDEGLFHLLHNYGGRRGVEEIPGILLRLYYYGESLPHPRRWWQQLFNSYDWVDQPLSAHSWQAWPASWRQALQQRTQRQIEQALAALTRARRWADRPTGPHWYLPALQEASDRWLQLQSVISRPVKEIEWDELRDQVAAPLPSLPTTGESRRRRPAGENGPAALAQPDPIALQQAKHEYDRVRDHWKRVADLFSFSIPQLHSFFSQQRPVVQALVRLVLEFDQRLTERKRQLNLIDFGDMEHLALQWLEGRAQAPSREGLRQEGHPTAGDEPSFVEVLVDEYQDINPLQEEILAHLARGARRFLVGDVKQSIYRFRHADPTIFLQRYRTYPPLGSPAQTVTVVTDGEPMGNGQRAGDGPHRLVLQENFRSRPGILAAVNWTFRQVMQADWAELDYGDDEELRPGLSYPPVPGTGGEPAVEVHLIEAKPDVTWASPQGEEPVEDEESKGDGQQESEAEAQTRAQREAIWIAERVRRLLHPASSEPEADHLVWDNQAQAYRRLTPRDVVILLRSWSHLRFYLEGLEQAGIPAVAQHGSGLFHTIELEQMLSFLQALDNPRQDIPLAAVLCSPLGGVDRLTVEELSQLRAYYPAEDLWDSCRQAAQSAGPLAEKMQRWTTRINQWRTQARREPLGQLVWQVWQQTGYYEYCGGLPGGRQRQANLQAFYEVIRQFDGFARQGLARCVRFLQNLQEAGSESPGVVPSAGAEEAVQILSIHNSKGLEFPVVIVAGLGDPFNDEDVRQKVLFHEDIGIALAAVDRAQGVSVRLPSQEAVAATAQAQSRAEELRILYVAMTRARERLILSGALRDLPAQVSRWCEVWGERGLPLPADRLRAGRCFLDWLGPAWVRHPDAAALRRLANLPESSTTAAETTQSRRDDRWAERAAAVRWQFFLHSAVEVDRLPQTWSRATEEATVSEGAGGQPEGDQAEASKPKLSEQQGAEQDERWLHPEWWRWTYPFQEAVQRPAKISVTDWQHQILAAEEQGEAVPLPPGQRRLPASWRWLTRTATDWAGPTFLHRPLASGAGPDAGAAASVTAASRGTATHLFLQHLDFQQEPLDAQALARQRDELVRREMCTRAEADSIPLSQIEQFLQTELGRWLVQTARRTPQNVRRELHFHLAVGVPPDRMMIQGAIDCLVETEEGGFVLLDYKTDQLPAIAASADGGLEPWVERYRFQLNVYRQAVERIFRRPVLHAYLVWLDLGGRVSEVPDDPSWWSQNLAESW
ncbi:MAG: helicase-exonuclease AddAB subunit AddA [Limnochordaceae bacterium]|nr:helicase-exonuclease AddAB subunit AddA [Limnochordaceae bacterium]